MPIKTVAKTTTLFVADDGTEYLDYELAKEHQRLLEMIEIIDRFYFSEMSLKDVALGIIEHLDDICFLQ